MILDVFGDIGAQGAKYMGKVRREYRPHVDPQECTHPYMVTSSDEPPPSCTPGEEQADRMYAPSGPISEHIVVHSTL